MKVFANRNETRFYKTASRNGSLAARALIATLAAMSGMWSATVQAAPVCSTGTNGIVNVTAPATRVNDY